MARVMARRLWYIPVLCLLLYAGLYFLGSRSEAFEFIKNTIKNSHTIEHKIGRVRQVALSPLGGYHTRFVNLNKTVHMTINVSGAKGRITIKVFAKKNDGLWKIKKALVDGRPIILN